MKVKNKSIEIATKFLMITFKSERDAKRMAPSGIEVTHFFFLLVYKEHKNNIEILFFKFLLKYMLTFTNDIH